MMSKQKRLWILAGLFVLLGGVYWGLGNTPLTVPVTYLYYALCLVLSILYVLVSGGLSPIPTKKAEKTEIDGKEKEKPHPVKKKERYRKFSVKAEEIAKTEKKEDPPRPNVLKIPEEKRPLFCQILLLSVIPFYLIFLLDWFYLHFFL